MLLAGNKGQLRYNGKKQFQSLKRLLLAYNAFSGCFITFHVDMFSLAKLIIMKHSAARVCTLPSAKPHNSPLCKHGKCPAFQHSVGESARTWCGVLQCIPPRRSREAEAEPKYVFCGQFWLVACRPIWRRLTHPAPPTSDPWSWDFAQSPFFFLFSGHVLLKHSTTDTQTRGETVKTQQNNNKAQQILKPTFNFFVPISLPRAAAT